MLVDAIRKRAKKKRTKKAGLKATSHFRKISWIIFLCLFGLAVLSSSFIFFGRIAADYIFDHIGPLSLFRDGKYLILFQNNAEIRSSGGFIGSFAVAEVQNFEIKNLSFNTNILALDRQFSNENFVEAPAKPLTKFLKGQSWTLRDSNYDASFPEASQDILSFYQKETGQKADGIIALNAKVVIDVLKLTGPIHLAKYNVTVSADNFYDVAQYQVEKAYFDNPENWVINEPKTFLKDLYPEIIKKAMHNKIALVKLLKKELVQKEIIFYFSDLTKEQTAVKENWAAKIPTNQELKDLFEMTNNPDYLYINSNSYSGDKSSIKIKETVDYRVEKNEQGNLKASLKITRIHTGTYDWPDGPNDTWIRIFVPEGSLLLGAKVNEQDIFRQITVGTEAEKTFFGYQDYINPGQASILEFSYLLPIKAGEYHIVVQKQPGVIDDKLTVLSQNELLYEGVLDGDKRL